jgi:hypothetical protein
LTFCEKAAVTVNIRKSGRIFFVKKELKVFLEKIEKAFDMVVKLLDGKFMNWTLFF